MKLLASDYDGTLRYEENVTEEDREALKRWKEAGNLFVMDTGRSMQSAGMEADRNGITADYYVTNNGGMVYDSSRRELFATYLDPLMSLDIMYIAKEIGGVVSYVVNDGYNRHRIIVDRELTEKRYPELEPDMEESELMETGKYAQIVISMAETGGASILARRINDHFSDRIIAYANKYAVDVVPKGISKASGLDFVREREGIPLEDTYTIGDADNDIPLMEYGDHGACIAGAEEDIKPHAKRIYRSVAEMIDDILNSEKENGNA